MSKFQNTFPIPQSDDPLDTLYDVANITACLGALLQNRREMEAMTTRGSRAIIGLSNLLHSTSDTVQAVTEDLEKDRQNSAGVFKHLMSQDTKNFSNLALTSYGPMLRRVLKRVIEDSERPESKRLPLSELMAGVEFDDDSEQRELERFNADLYGDDNLKAKAVNE